MKHTEARKLIVAALKRADERLCFAQSDTRLPSNKGTEWHFVVNTGPGTVCTNCWVKRGRLQTDTANGYTYIDIGNATQLQKWAEQCRDLIRTQQFVSKLNTI